MEKFIKEIYDLRPWYHDFKKLGVSTNFHPKKKFFFFGPQVPQIRRSVHQQPRKESVIEPYIKNALEKIEEKSNLRILDLFCADGYYGFLTQKLCPNASLVGVDLNEEDLHRCKVIASHLKLGEAKFVKDDVYHFIENSEPFDLVLCFGGLYHIPNPKQLLEGLKLIIKHYLVVQTAITVEHDDPDYFEVPNPDFKTWGCWFTHSRFIRWVEEVGYEILESTWNKRNEPNPRYIGASFCLLKPI